jgi:stress responsive alpha/beta barrel protein
MQIHIALYKWKSSVAPEQIGRALDKVKALQTIPGITEIIWAENTSKYSEGYTHVIFVCGENKAALDAYRNHPEHVLLADEIEEMEDQGIGVDFTT